MWWLALGVGTAAADSFYVDPVAGSPDGDGSFGDPWRTLREVVEAGLIETRAWDSYPYTEDSVLVPRDEGAPVGPADVVFLRAGNHGTVTIAQAYNLEPIFIAAYADHTPTLTALHIRGSGNWVFRGITVGDGSLQAGERVALVHADADPWFGPVHSLVFEGCRVETVADTLGWSAADWASRVLDGVLLEGAGHVFEGNTVRHVVHGLTVDASETGVHDNTIERFSGDGIRILGSGSRILGNLVRDPGVVGGGSHAGVRALRGDASDEVRDTTISGNRILAWSGASHDHQGIIEGISILEGTHVDTVIENTIVVSERGITLQGMRGLVLVNNSLVDIDPDSAWVPGIRVAGHADGTPSEGVVRNNLAGSLDLEGVLADHNLVYADPDAHFVERGGDAALRIESAAVDGGSSARAPTVDVDGIGRPQGRAVDVGATERLLTCADVGGVCCPLGTWCALSVGAVVSGCPMCCTEAACNDVFSYQAPLVDTGRSPDGPSCACAAGPVHPAPWALALLALVRRRRRPHSSSGTPNTPAAVSASPSLQQPPATRARRRPGASGRSIEATSVKGPALPARSIRRNR